MDEQFIDAIDRLERALCEQYRVETLKGVGALGDAIAAARAGDLRLITGAMEGREMYRWADAAREALSDARSAQPASREAPARGQEPPTTEQTAEPPPRTRKRTERSE
jgi:hypothetical protein